MEKYFKRKSATELSSTPTKKDSSSKNSTTNPLSTDVLPTDHFSTNRLPTDPGLRPRISEYNPNDQDQIRRFYLQKGACQPRNHEFPQTLFGKGNRRFNPDWFDEHPYWLEYSIEKDSLFCLCCYLFKEHIGDQAGGDVFVVKGFSNWKKKEKLRTHVGGPNSAHNNAMTMCRNLMSQKQQIQNFFSQQSDKARNEYRIRLTATIDCLRYCVRQGLAFRGNDESYESSNQGLGCIFSFVNPMKHIVKIMTLLVAISAFWIGLLQLSVVPHSYTWLLPIYFIVSLGCYGLLMVGVGLMHFPTCPQEALLLQQDVVEAKEFLKQKDVDVGSD